MLHRIEEYRNYLASTGHYLHHIASCGRYEYPIENDYVSYSYKGRFGEGIKLVSTNPNSPRYLRVEYWIKEE